MRIISVFFKEKEIKRLTEGFAEVVYAAKDLSSCYEWWKKEKEPEIDFFFINGSKIYEDFSFQMKGREDQFLEDLAHFRAQIGKIRAKLIFPLEKNSDTMLLINLLGNDYQDFWFCEKLEKEEIRQIFETNRSREDAEKYINALPLPQEYYEEEEEEKEDLSVWIEKAKRSLKTVTPKLEFPKISLPFHPEEFLQKEKEKSLLPLKRSQDTLLFYSLENPLLCYATAIFTALYYSLQGMKILTVECGGSSSRLGQSLGIRSQFFHLAALINDYKEKKEMALEEYCFTPSSLKKEDSYLDQNPYLKEYPKSLYFLPDCYSPFGDFVAYWPKISSQIMNWAFLEMGMNYVIYIYSGWNKEILDLLKPARIVIDCMESWPFGISENLKRKGKSGFRRIPVLNSSGSDYGKKEMERLGISSVIAPKTLEEDFYKLMYFESSPAKISSEVLEYIQKIDERVNL